ncbi:AT-rich interactive domain-containing protein 2 [Apostasia shenzhenica]|uniref:AT-rich interactive domain-containing protein 2 n=1 Tax=Apostasia shenzhenica TaxID=1088818 RepID=A0A2I0A578_9ASPA|nr:AT-rich interactive domain-containing protein 2 [Apostasia shenzhenica]
MYSGLNDDSSQLVCENSREVNIGESPLPLFIPVLEKYQLSDLESEGFHSKSEAESRNSCDGNSAADKVSKEQTTDVPCDSTISVHSCLRAAEDAGTVTSLVHFKRPYGDGNSDDVVRKRARQKDRDKKLVSSPGISSLIICLNETPASEETLATADLDDNAESLTDNSLSSPCLASNSGDRHIQFSSCHEYFGNDDRRLEIDPLEVLRSPLSDYLHCRLVPIGPSHQAVIPELRSRLALKNGALSFDLGVDVGSNDKWLGACAVAMPDLSSVVMECQNCCSLRECDCPDEGSMRCARQHIMEARERLKLRLGNEKFFQLGFCEMGEVVSQKWTRDEETLFHKVVLLNPASLGRNFWPVLSRAFRSRSCKELVSYYFNVFILRKRAEQNRFDPLKADSDNDEWQESSYDEVAISDEEEVEEDQEDSVVESPVDVDDVGIRTCLSEQGDMHDDEVYDEDYDDEDKGFFGDSDGFRGIRLKAKNTSQTIDKHSSDVADDQDIQDDSCTSYEGQFNLCDDFGVHGKTDAINCITDDEYVKGCHDSKLWEINCVGAVEKDMELLPTCHVIEEVFGKETVENDAGCTP